MLVLSRKPGEQIVIGEGFVVTVLEVRGNRVKLGSAGQAEVHRAELAHGERPPAPRAGVAQVVTR